MRRQIVPQEASVQLAATGASDTLSADDYKDKLLKQIPAEAIAAYLTLDGVIRSSAHGSAIAAWLWVAFFVGLTGTPLYLWRLQSVTSPVQLSVSTVSFALWVFALGGAFARYSWYNSWYASVVLVSFTFLVPALLGKSPAGSPQPTVTGQKGDPMSTVAR